MGKALHPNRLIGFKNRMCNNMNPCSPQGTASPTIEFGLSTGNATLQSQFAEKHCIPTDEFCLKIESATLHPQQLNIL